MSGKETPILPFAWELVRSRRKTLCIEITRDARVLVRAPLRQSERAILLFLRQRQDWVLDHLARRRAALAARPEPTAEEEAVLRAQAKAQLPPLAARWAEKMGVSYTGIAITGARARFGSCSPKNSLCFSFRLMRYPQRAVEYVVVHELAHILIKNHSPAFYALVERFLPDWRERQALLRD
ncbi:MAG: M48 family metallopeptidase [Clostridia bacterium]|nr:M48 family metallopeptidase [Clostridia bacterium]